MLVTYMDLFIRKKPYEKYHCYDRITSKQTSLQD